MNINNCPPFFSEIKSSELQVVLKCANLELSHNDISAISMLISAGIDWPLLLELAQHHRLLPLVYTNLNRGCSELVPADVLEHLKKLYEQNAHHNLVQAAELKRITSAFNAEGVDIAVIKGWALIKSLYGDISLRQSHDVDLLVRQTNVIDADSILYSLGYHITHTKNRFQLDTQVGRRLLRRRQELDYWSEKRRTYIDLHWRLALSHASLPVDIDRLWNEMDVVSEGSRSINQLSDTMQFVFLCYHGAKHCWLRLHWLNDIALLMKKDQLDWDSILIRAEELGVLPAVGLAISLASILLEAPIPRSLKHQNDLLMKGEQLAFKMLPDMVRTPEEIDKNVQPFVDFKRVYFGYQLQTRWPHRLFTWTDLLFPSVTDYRAIKIPDRLSILYYLVRPALLIRKLISRIVNTISSRVTTGIEIGSKNNP